MQVSNYERSQKIYNLEDNKHPYAAFSDDDIKVVTRK
jgi:nitrous-oxide reductase